MNLILTVQQYVFFFSVWLKMKFLKIYKIVAKVFWLKKKNRKKKGFIVIFFKNYAIINAIEIGLKKKNSSELRLNSYKFQIFFSSFNIKIYQWSNKNSFIGNLFFIFFWLSNSNKKKEEKFLSLIFFCSINYCNSCNLLSVYIYSLWFFSLKVYC